MKLRLGLRTAIIAVFAKKNTVVAWTLRLSHETTVFAKLPTEINERAANVFPRCLLLDVPPTHLPKVFVVRLKWSK
jgi:hypothetical protein